MFGIQLILPSSRVPYKNFAARGTAGGTRGPDFYGMSDMHFTVLLQPLIMFFVRKYILIL